MKYLYNNSVLMNIIEIHKLPLQPAQHPFAGQNTQEICTKMFFGGWYFSGNMLHSKINSWMNFNELIITQTSVINNSTQICQLDSEQLFYKFYDEWSFF